MRRSKHLCWVLQKNTYTKEWDEGGYRYFKMRCHPSTGYETWPQGTDKNGTVYGYIANPKYAAGFDSDGLIGCGSGRPPINYSATATMWACGASAAHSMRAHPADCSNGSLP